ncbi:DUF3825 domain-containing protein [uncultured Adlercreutzia sp.]|uniref:DUF3825 domain-containing protein n=1 Tax=uncultured Adlercreutzia sp. TaxID=875803 RepID=UPI0026F38494|nr:DUF3825 domain-containing protein [uncultured Adlercreutzia sp.]
MQLRDWAFLGNWEFFTNRLRQLAREELEPEKWSFAGKDDFGILKNYLFFTFDKLMADRESAPDSEKQSIVYVGDTVACFNTGLFDKNWQTVYFYCEKNPISDRQPWRFVSFHNNYTIKNCPIDYDACANLQRANYFEDPSALLFDSSLEIVPQWQHIIHDEKNYQRIPQSLRDNGATFCQSVMEGQISSVRKRIAANYKTIVPQYYRGRIQLLMPLYLTNPESPDLALVLSLSDDKKVYYGHTCLTIEMAYNNARLIARPDSYWLKA